MLSRLGIAFLSRNKCLLISWLQSPSSVNLEPQGIKSVTVSIVSPSICHEVIWLDAMILVFWMLSFKATFHSPLSLSSRRHTSTYGRFMLPYGRNPHNTVKQLSFNQKSIKKRKRTTMKMEGTWTQSLVGEVRSHVPWVSLNTATTDPRCLQPEKCAGWN